MKLYTTLVATAATIMVTGTLTAQATPNFTGKWELNGEKTAAARAAAPAPASNSISGGGMRGSGGGTMAPAGAGPIVYTLAQTSQELTITRDLGDGGMQKWVYKLDGAESINTNGRTTLTTRSKFVAGTLVTEGRQITKSEQGETTGTFKEVRSIGKDGSMVVATTRAIDGGATVTGHQVLDRKK